MTTLSPSLPTTTGSVHAHLADTVSVAMDRVGAIVLSGGRGSRLFPLTDVRSKPATPFGGRYRLIDIPLSNALNAQINKLYVLTQYLSGSLHAHLLRSYSQPPASSGYLQILTPEETPTRCSWYEGTADAVRHHLTTFANSSVDYFLILSGDQLYQMDFRRLVAMAQVTDADLTVATLPVNEEDAQRMGVMRVDRSSRVIEFAEKPTDPEPLATPTAELMRMGWMRPGSRRFLGSMGIYLFKKRALIELVTKDPGADFGKHLIPNMIQGGGVFAYLFDGYWEDIGTLKAYYDANMTVTKEGGPFSLHRAPFYGEPVYLPGALVSKTELESSILEAGSIIHAKRISHSIIGPRSVIGDGTVISYSYVIGNDAMPAENSIGKNCHIHKAIIDRNARIGDGVTLINAEGRMHFDGNGVCIRDGIIVVTSGTQLPDGFRL